MTDYNQQINRGYHTTGKEKMKQFLAMSCLLFIFGNEVISLAVLTMFAGIGIYKLFFEMGKGGYF